MSKTVTQLNEMLQKRAALIEQNGELLAKAANETRGLTSEEQTEHDNRASEIRNLADTVKNLKEQQELERSLAAGQEAHSGVQGEQRTYTDAFRAMLRNGGLNGLSAADINALEARATQNTGTDSAGGYLVPTDTLPDVDIATLFTGEVERIAGELVTSTSAPVEMPTNDESTAANQTAETSAVAEQAMTLGQIVFNAYSADTLVNVSRKLLLDSAANVEALVADLAGERIRRKMNAMLTTGTGSGQPQGIITGASAGVTAASATAISVDDILALKKSVDKSYRRSAKFGFMANDDIAGVIQGLGFGASNDFPIYIPALSENETDRVLGTPLYINNDMAGTVEASAKTLLVGDFSKFIVRKAGGISMEVSPHANFAKREVAYMFYRWYDSKVVNSKAIKYLTQAAS